MEDIGIGDIGVLLLDGLKKLDGSSKSGVGTVVDFGVETDGSDGSASTGVADIVGSRVVPRKTDEDGSTVLFVDDILNHPVGAIKVGLLDLKGGGGASGIEGGREGGSRGEEEGETGELHFDGVV